MKRLFGYIVFLLLITVLVNGCSENSTSVNIVTEPISPLASSYDAKYATDWMWLSGKIIADESRDNPPQAGRIYSYLSIGLYECIVQGMPMYRSLSGQLKEMPQMPLAYPAYEYDWPSVLTGAMPILFRGLYRVLHNTSHNMINNMASNQRLIKYSEKDSSVINRSIILGEAIAVKILEWANNDGFYRINGAPYNPPSIFENPANWEPINPGDTAVEPYWGTLRTFAVQSASSNYLAPSYSFDTTAGSPFYIDQLEIKQIRENITPEQREIALFWRDKQLTLQPPGHWVSIVYQMISKHGYKLDKAAEAFGYLGIGIGDAFISCWYAKYFDNYLRPQSFIRRYMQPGWTPLLPTPPFPDYPSGHSTSSGTCSYLLTKVFGELPFTDTTHLRIGMPPRSFNNFKEAAVECSNSRIYGGIHYRNACENGVLMGENIGADIYSRVKLRKNQ
ncbi:MAG: vanadium-dependent haloperoxidase [Ignavibacteria bacterium]|nr:vanadium-dependent haloperoxidase [Ignavibacteria bacterium]